MHGENLKLIQCSVRDPKSTQQTTTYCGRGRTLLTCNPWNTKRRLLYLRTQFVPRCKHFSSRL